MKFIYYFFILTLLMCVACNNSKGINMHLVVGEPIVNVLNNDFYNSDKLDVTGDVPYTVKNLWNLNPNFIGKSYSLSEKSILKNKGTDKKDLGIISNN